MSTSQPTPAPAPAAMYRIATASQVAAALPSKTAKRSPWLLLGGALILAMLALGVVARLTMVTPKPACGPGCVPPPPRQGHERLSLRASNASTGPLFAVQVDPNLPQPQVSTGSAIGWSLHTQGGGNLVFGFAGGNAGGHGAEAFVDGYQQSQLPQAIQVYQVPGDEIGYIPAYGVVYDVPASPGSGQALEERALVSAAVKGNVVIRKVAITPVVANGTSKANPSQLYPPVVQIIDNMANTVIWKGD